MSAGQGGHVRLKSTAIWPGSRCPIRGGSTPSPWHVGRAARGVRPAGGRQCAALRDRARRGRQLRRRRRHPRVPRRARRHGRRAALSPRGAGAALAAVAACPHPVVAQIEGVCVGGGLEIASQCDLRIAGASRVSACRSTAWVSDGARRDARPDRAGGRAAALAILLEGRVFGADEARAMGLLTRVVDDAQVATEARRSAERIAQARRWPPASTSACRAGWPKAAR